MTQSPVTMLKSIALADIALPSNRAYGKALYDRGGVTLIQVSDDEIEAWVGGLSGTSADGGGSRRRVRFWVDQGTLRWRCTGNPKNHEIFCKHCVAVTLSIQNLAY